MHTEQTRQSWIMKETTNRKARIDGKEWGVGFVIRGVPDVSGHSMQGSLQGAGDPIPYFSRTETPDPAAVKLLNILVKFPV